MGSTALVHPGLITPTEAVDAMASLYFDVSEVEACNKEGAGFWFVPRKQIRRSQRCGHYRRNLETFPIKLWGQYKWQGLHNGKMNFGQQRHRTIVKLATYLAVASLSLFVRVAAAENLGSVNRRGFSKAKKMLQQCFWSPCVAHRIQLSPAEDQDWRILGVKLEHSEAKKNSRIIEGS